MATLLCQAYCKCFVNISSFKLGNNPLSQVLLLISNSIISDEKASIWSKALWSRVPPLIVYFSVRLHPGVWNSACANDSLSLMTCWVNEWMNCSSWKFFHLHYFIWTSWQPIHRWHRWLVSPSYKWRNRVLERWKQSGLLEGSRAGPHM